MTSPFDLSPRETAELGFARSRDIAFDAVRNLWQRRQKEGMSQIDLAKAIGKDAGWVSRKLRGPANWTLKTFGAFVEGLRGEPVITVRAIEDHPSRKLNHHAYVDYAITTEGYADPPISKNAVTAQTTSRKPIALTVVE